MNPHCFVCTGKQTRTHAGWHGLGSIDQRQEIQFTTVSFEKCHHINFLFLLCPARTSFGFGLFLLLASHTHPNHDGAMEKKKKKTFHTSTLKKENFSKLKKNERKKMIFVVIWPNLLGSVHLVYTGHKIKFRKLMINEQQQALFFTAGEKKSTWNAMRTKQILTREMSEGRRDERKVVCTFFEGNELQWRAVQYHSLCCVDRCGISATFKQ